MMTDDHYFDEVSRSVECDNCLQWTDTDFFLLYDTTYEGECQHCKHTISKDFEFDIIGNDDAYDSYYDR